MFFIWNKEAVLGRKIKPFLTLEWDIFLVMYQNAKKKKKILSGRVLKLYLYSYTDTVTAEKKSSAESIISFLYVLAFFTCLGILLHFIYIYIYIWVTYCAKAARNITYF